MGGEGTGEKGTGQEGTRGGRGSNELKCSKKTVNTFGKIVRKQC